MKRIKMSMIKMNGVEGANLNRTQDVYAGVFDFKNNFLHKDLYINLEKINFSTKVFESARNIKKEFLSIPKVLKNEKSFTKNIFRLKFLEVCESARKFIKGFLKLKIIEKNRKEFCKATKRIFLQSFLHLLEDCSKFQVVREGKWSTC